MVASGGSPPQNPRIDASWEVIAADALCCSGFADFLVDFPWNFVVPSFYRRNLVGNFRNLSLTDLSELLPTR